MSETQNDPAAEFNQELNARTQANLAQTVGQQIISLVQANAAAELWRERAVHYGQLLEGNLAEVEKVRQEIEELRKELEDAPKPFTLQDVSVADLSIEAARRGYVLKQLPPDALLPVGDPATGE